MRATHVVVVLMFASLAAACSDDPTGVDVPVFVADAAQGRLAFVDSCSGCHASGDGLDLSFFGFSDTTIVRRAVAHVDTATALNIVAHIRTLGEPVVHRDDRIFQPGGGMVSSDVAFAERLFGHDAWPAGLTTGQLAAIDPRDVRMAVPMPVWSDEERNIDWMPDEALPDAILDFAGSAARGAIAGYRAAPTVENLGRAVVALRNADRNMANPGAPCVFDDPARVDYEACFQARRWTSSLVAQHMIRHGMTEPISSTLHDTWWDVGNAARKSRNADQPIDNALLNWASWMVLGWSFDPGRHASTYTGGALSRGGLVRHATFVALRSQVSRARGAASPYEDARQAIRFAPAAWAHQVALFGLRHLLERQAGGDRPTRAEPVASAIQSMERAVIEAKRKLTGQQLAEIEALAGKVLEALTSD